MKGLRNSADYLNDTIQQEKPDIICLQETWHMKNACDYFGNLHDDYLFVEQSGMNYRENILAGRPYGGVAILYRKAIGKAIKVDISNKRMCAQCVAMERWLCGCYQWVGKYVECV